MFAEQLRVAVQEAMWKRGVQQAELGRRSDLSDSAISRFLRGERFLSPGAVDRVLAVLGLELEIGPRRGREEE
jgi:transcriptional regulator with XRE-family HTH domain